MSAHINILLPSINRTSDVRILNRFDASTNPCGISCPTFTFIFLFLCNFLLILPLLWSNPTRPICISIHYAILCHRLRRRPVILPLSFVCGLLLWLQFLLATRLVISGSGLLWIQTARWLGLPSFLFLRLVWLLLLTLLFLIVLKGGWLACSFGEMRSIELIMFFVHTLVFD